MHGDEHGDQNETLAAILQESPTLFFRQSLSRCLELPKQTRLGWPRSFQGSIHLVSASLSEVLQVCATISGLHHVSSGVGTPVLLAIR